MNLVCATSSLVYLSGILCACVDHRLEGDVVAMGIHGVGCM
jgi:hypothetical protein